MLEIKKKNEVNMSEYSSEMWLSSSRIQMHPFWWTAHWNNHAEYGHYVIQDFFRLQGIKEYLLWYLY